MYKETLSIEKQLEKTATENYEYSNLWSTWNLNKKTLKPILNAIIKDYPHYSLHDHTHSESILINIERLLGNDNIEKLSPTDLWIILHVAYLHDFGMVILDSKIHDFWDTEEFKAFLKEQSESTDEDAQKAAKLILDFNENKDKYNDTWPLEIKSAVTLLVSIYCRWQHSTFSKEYILDINAIWNIDLGHNGLIKKRFLSLIANISEIHTKPFDNVFKLPIEENGYRNDYTHPRLIACLLRLGDVLDLDNGRFNLYGEKIFGEMPDTSRIHLYKHESTKHLLITDEVIEVEADCPTDEVYRETRKWYDSLKSEMDNVNLNWSDIATKEFNHPPKLKPYRILRNGVEDSYELSNLKFTISQSKAFELIEGSSIYKDKFSCIREIVQNAEDATKIQLWRDLKSGMYTQIDASRVNKDSLLPIDIDEWIYNNYPIKISVEINENNKTIVIISDHGTGITLNTLKAICNVGQSYFQNSERKKEIDEMPAWLRPTANFGIGLQSCFMLTDKITIFTKANDNEDYKITLKSGKQEGYVNVEKNINKTTRGSDVVLELSDISVFKLDLFGYTAKNMAYFDPFKNNNVMPYRVIESIYKECKNGFFNITVDSKYIGLSETIPAYICEKKNFFPTIPDKGFLYSISESYDTAIFWYNNNLYTIRPDINSQGHVDVSFKGKAINKTHIANHNYAGFDIKVDIYGLPAKDTLSLNREELRYDAGVQVCKDIIFLIKQYLDIMFEKEEILKKHADVVDALMLTSWLYEIDFPKAFSKYLSNLPSVKCYFYDQENGNRGFIQYSLKELYEEYSYPYIYYTDVNIGKSYYFGKASCSEDEFLKGLKANEYIDSYVILIDDNIKKFLSLSKCDDIYLNVQEPVTIVHKISQKNILYSPDSYTQKQLIKKLVYKETGVYSAGNMYIMRAAIPAFKKYEHLAVDIQNLSHIAIVKNSDLYIISPITFNDEKERQKHSLESFKNYIINQPVFNDIVDYVNENCKFKTDRETIIQDYERLIGEYYDLMTNPE